MWAGRQGILGEGILPLWVYFSIYKVIVCLFIHSIGIP